MLYIVSGEDTKVVSYRIPDILPAPEFRRQINNTNVVGTTSNSKFGLLQQSTIKYLGKILIKRSGLENKDELVGLRMSMPYLMNISHQYSL